MKRADYNIQPHSHAQPEADYELILLKGYSNKGHFLNSRLNNDIGIEILKLFWWIRVFIPSDLFRVTGVCVCTVCWLAMHAPPPMPGGNLNKNQIRAWVLDSYIIATRARLNKQVDITEFVDACN